MARHVLDGFDQGVTFEVDYNTRNGNVNFIECRSTAPLPVEFKVLSPVDGVTWTTIVFHPGTTPLTPSGQWKSRLVATSDPDLPAGTMELQLQYPDGWRGVDYIANYPAPGFG